MLFLEHAHLTIPVDIVGPQARQAHPVLARYEDDWATAEIAKQYMQNARSHARDMGYIEKAGRKGRSDGENLDPPEEGGTD